MFYETKVIEGVLHERYSSDAKFQPMSARAITALLTSANEEVSRLRNVIIATLMENGHLADGEVCTLSLLKKAVKWE